MPMKNLLKKFRSWRAARAWARCFRLPHGEAKARAMTRAKQLEARV